MMEPKDYDMFLKNWMSVEAQYNNCKPKSPDDYQTTFILLQEYELAEVLQATLQHARESEFPPTPASVIGIIKRMRGETPDRMLVKIEQFLSVFRDTVDCGTDYICEDRRAAWTFLTCFGSLDTFGETMTSSWPSDRKRFTELYMALQPSDYAGFDGIIRSHNHRAPQVRLTFIGDPRKCVEIVRRVGCYDYARQTVLWPREAIPFLNSVELPPPPPKALPEPQPVDNEPVMLNGEEIQCPCGPDEVIALLEKMTRYMNPANAVKDYGKPQPGDEKVMEDLRKLNAL